MTASEIEPLLAAWRDPTVTELMVNDDGSVYLERPGGPLERLPGGCTPEAAAALVRALSGEDGFGPDRPQADLSGGDGCRLHVVAPPLARALCVTARKRPPRRPTLEELVELGLFTRSCAAFLNLAILERKSILISGGAGSGKTTLLNALAGCAPRSERIIVIEDMPELQLPQPHVVSMRPRLQDPQGRPDVPMRELVAGTLRMRPDRIIVGEVRGSEAADLLQAMNVGQEGVLSTLHASSAREALQRLETLVLLSGLDAPLRAVRSYVSTAVDLVVFLARLADGSRRTIQVSEITGLELETITMADLFRAEPRKSAGGLAYALRPTGAIPRFYEELRRAGQDPPMDFFKDQS